MAMKETAVFIGALAVCSATVVHAAGSVRIEGYLEFRKGSFLIVDGQRIQTSESTKFKGSDKAKSLGEIPIGYEIKGKGVRESGTVMAEEIEAKPNGMAMFEKDVIASTEQAEKAYVEAKEVYDAGKDGKKHVIGKLYDSGPEVERARRIVLTLLPTYVEPSSVHVYVVENKEWNAMAMANYSIYVFTGLMRDLNDDELAVVLGHEIAHATHEHSRLQASKNLYGGLAGSAASFGASLLGNPLARQAAETATALGVTTFGNAFSREYEDQADRVGLRYVYEAGYDHTKAPALWKRFAEKYGDGSKVENFFFGDHSLSSERAAALEKEIKRNYRDPAKDPPSHPKG